MALSLLECTEILKIVNTNFGNLPRSGLLEQGAEADRQFAALIGGSLALAIAQTRLRGLRYRAELSYAPPAFSLRATRAGYHPLELTKPTLRFQSPPELERSWFCSSTLHVVLKKNPCLNFKQIIKFPLITAKYLNPSLSLFCVTC